ncbi:hypothetical protein GA0004736_2445 [Curtobacterium sp. 9128]|uniref:copper resistance CopC family protein n=1 Tax=Curtobacterium sp. 9128 TaxID=1793722 RepID=UPI0007D7341E|nr:copper resistance CopC family protein [Curtobacterium sp. 9128]SBN63510.1 hypothetical protein GA0004736_2445 [Curtobacterium sp. 9128]
MRRILQSSVAAAVLVLTTLVATEPASAHSALTASNPADGATVTTPLERVELTFSQAPLAGLDAGLRMEVRDAAGTDVSNGEVLVDGTTMSTGVRVEDGAYSVRWRYVSPDGHPITGELGFTVALPAASTPTAVPSPSSSSVDVTRSATAPPVSGADGGSPWYAGPAPWIGGGALLLAVALVLVATTRGRRTPAEE